jgi:hypothetical protein
MGTPSIGFQVTGYSAFVSCWPLYLAHCRTIGNGAGTLASCLVSGWQLRPDRGLPAWHADKAHTHRADDVPCFVMRICSNG